MKKRTKMKQRNIISVTALVLAAFAARGSYAQERIASLDVNNEPWEVDVYYENDTHYRGDDDAGRNVGLSKFRNTLQAEADKKLSNGWSFHGVFRGTYDGVYELNKDQFGKTAGSRRAEDVRLLNTAGPVAAGLGVPLPPVHLGATVPFGGGGRAYGC